MKMEEWMAQWGPALPIFLTFAWILHRLVFKIVPAGFKRLAVSQLEIASTMKDNHEEAIEELRALRAEMKKVKKRCGPCKAHPLNKRTPTKR